MIKKGMKLHIDCRYGAAGDMLTAALLDLVPAEDRAEVLKELNSIGIEGVVYEADEVTKHGQHGASVKVLIHGDTEDNHEHHTGHHHHHGRGLAEIKQIIDSLNINGSVKVNALGVYEMLAQAESEAHNEAVDLIHFHEVGALDAIADITAVCCLLDLFMPAAITASPVGVGSGTIRCAHGILPVPAPATANLLRGIPTCHDDLIGELCTPTGAALIRFFAESFCEEDGITPVYNAYGFGSKDFDWPNCVRVAYGE